MDGRERMREKVSENRIEAGQKERNTERGGASRERERERE